MPMNALLKRRQMQVSHLYRHMRNLHVISQDPIMAGEQVVQEVASAILTQQHLYAQLTVAEISRLLTDGLASLDFELWLPKQAIDNPQDFFFGKNLALSYQNKEKHRFSKRMWPFGQKNTHTHTHTHTQVKSPPSDPCAI